MARVPFKVSARAARLIGRENVASSQGAVTELVKNAYDADATACLVLFLRRWRATPSSYTPEEMTYLERIQPKLKDLVDLQDGIWRVRRNITEKERALLEAVSGAVLDLWIIDNGHGMAANVIEDQWMVIGTDAKEQNSRSNAGRVVTGAKGIGRFALDRLGQEGELYSALADSPTLVHWLVDWTDFEGAGKVIDDVQAVLEIESGSLDKIYEANHLANLLPRWTPDRGAGAKEIAFNSGTAIRIGLLSDVWDEKDTSRLGATLEALLPPHDRGGFDIFVYDDRNEKASGFLDNFPPDQFDYRMHAAVRSDGTVSVNLTRQEIDVPRISPTVFQLDGMKKSPYTLEDFERGGVSFETTLASVVGVDEANVGPFREIGPFSFTLYFFKLQNPTKDVLERFPQKNFDVNGRKKWLQNSGGIRLYRDNFRVRPYGEPRTPSSDWLLLGERSTRNPVQASRVGWRATPQVVAGTIHITKHDNPLLADQSNREGIANERVFTAFREIVVGLVRQFEYDRSYILSQFSKAYDIDHPQQKAVEEGAKIAKKVVETSVRSDADADEQAGGPAGPSSNQSSDDLKKVAIAFTSERRKNDALRDDIQVMRGMATLGTVLVSFTHELKQLQANLDSRSTRLSDSIKEVADEEKLAQINQLMNPLHLVERLRRQDEKISRWVNFALSSVSPNKRRRREISIQDYMIGLSEYWSEFLISKNVQFDPHVSPDVGFILAHEIDLDSIFYNLINNSVEALVRPSEHQERRIGLTASMIDAGVVQFDYKDNGPGLSASLNVAEDIFSYGITTKKQDSNGDSMGTGLGMWLLKNIIDDYKGDVHLRCQIGSPGFAISIRLPLHQSDR